MKKIFGILSVTVFSLAFTFNSNSVANDELSLADVFALNTANAECNGVYHDGNDDSWLGDGWDDFWNEDWEQEVVPCYSSVEVSTANGGIKIVLKATSEKIGCSGGNGSCCEALCEDGAA